MIVNLFMLVLRFLRLWNHLNGNSKLHQSETSVGGFSKTRFSIKRGWFQTDMWLLVSISLCPNLISCGESTWNGYSADNQDLYSETEWGFYFLNEAVELYEGSVSIFNCVM